ncbi:MULTISPECIES: 3-deoxy-manno-octulosonate cytidylyltransferase [unclassified Sphingobium]|uniref:3-deoxy-manno-octulosonate cytidylyltransferase n=1 Tax=unclassified Sphingobium TaxID=2611147 RepID=UPI00222496D5|nr:MULTISPECIES: manno-octulosonate cytidylyltransferase [unclassified Sphingobium]MCW2382166.1 3-deoxy-manno-octulosonate cytidylyltransferase (CMP-KDO synthetase) [Sphingobium sp. B2D3B]MCW2397661.1 3-deoxy-manno-octulosonate cytidylyltransferase (CMP-KDO synthetase) [Sphingobium sp. B2D3C]
MSERPALANARTVIIIPTRYGSSRYPGKPLAPIMGPDGITKTLIGWSHDGALAVSRDAAVVVATDDKRITDEVDGFGGQWLMTPESCGNGTERVAACLDALPNAQLLVNFQGDALLTPPAFVTALIDHMNANSEAQVATVAVRCSAETYRHLAEDAAQGRVGGTTVVVNDRSEALYFSKRILPYLPDGRMPDEDMPVLLHLGLYAYRRAALERYVALGPTMLEAVEGLEQLRFLVAGIPVSVVTLEEQGYPIVEVNNPSDVPLVEGILSARALP